MPCGGKEHLLGIVPEFNEAGFEDVATAGPYAAGAGAIPMQVKLPLGWFAAGCGQLLSFVLRAHVLLPQSGKNH